MIFLLLCLFLNYEVLHCDQRGKAVRKIPITEQLHQSIYEINSLLQTVRREIQLERSKLRTANINENIFDNGFVDYSIADMWWNGTEFHQIGRMSSNTTPPTPPPSVSDKRASRGAETVNFFKTPSLGPPDTDVKYLRATLNPTLMPPLRVPISTLEVKARSSSTANESTSSKPYPRHTSNYRKEVKVSYVGPAFMSNIRAVKTKLITTKSTGQSHNKSELASLHTSHDTLNKTSPGPFIPESITSLPPNMSLYLRQAQDTTEVSETINLFAMSHFTKPYGDYMKKWFHESTADILAENWIVSLTPPPPRGRVQSTTPGRVPPRIVTRLSKAQAWVRKRHKQTSPKQVSDMPRQGILPGVHLEVPTPAEDDYGYYTATGKQAQFLLEDEFGHMYLGTTPMYDENTKITMVSGIPAYIPVEITFGTSPAAGAVLFENDEVTTPLISEIQPYHDMMDEIDEGFMMVFLLELTKIVSLKNATEVAQVIRHGELMINDLFDNIRLAWLGEPLQSAVVRISRFMSSAEMDVVQTYSAMLHRLLKDRRTALSVDVNSIIDYADALYEDDEGEQLFEVIREFEDYPNITRTSRELCLALFDSFMQPYRRLRHSERRQALLDSINYALQLRFPQRRSNEDIVPLGDELETIRNLKRHKRKQTFRTGNKKKKRRQNKRRGHRKHRTERRNNRNEIINRRSLNEYPTLKSTVAFRVLRRTSSTVTQQTGPVKDDIHKTSAMSQVPTKDAKAELPHKDLNNRQMTSAASSKEPHLRNWLHRHPRQETRTKANLVRQTVHESSYSDEEAYLKMKLVSALLHGKRKKSSYDED